MYRKFGCNIECIKELEYYCTIQTEKTCKTCVYPDMGTCDMCAGNEGYSTEISDNFGCDNYKALTERDDEGSVNCRELIKDSY